MKYLKKNGGKYEKQKSSQKKITTICLTDLKNSTNFDLTEQSLKKNLNK